MLSRRSRPPSCGDIIAVTDRAIAISHAAPHHARPRHRRARGHAGGKQTVRVAPAPIPIRPRSRPSRDRAGETAGLDRSAIFCALFHERKARHGDTLRERHGVGEGTARPLARRRHLQGKMETSEINRASPARAAADDRNEGYRSSHPASDGRIVRFAKPMKRHENHPRGPAARCLAGARFGLSVGTMGDRYGLAQVFQRYMADQHVPPGLGHRRRGRALMPPRIQPPIRRRRHPGHPGASHEAKGSPLSRS